MNTLTWMIVAVGAYSGIMSIIVFLLINDLNEKQKDHLKRVWRAIEHIQGNNKQILVTDIKSCFCHKLFMDTVADYYKMRIPADKQIESYIKSVATGIPVSTNIFIALCNEMSISPINFFKSRK